jgi:hypothetical protein
MTLTDGPTTTLVGHSMTGEGPDNSIPVGEGHAVGGWDLRVLEQDADEAPVLFVNPDGTFLVGIGVAARWLGPVNAAQLPVLSEAVRFLAVGADGRELSAEAEGCPDPLPWAEPGQFPEGNVCFRVPPAAAYQIQVITEDLGDAPPHRAYFSTDASPEIRCSGRDVCSVRYLRGPELTPEQFLATDIGQTLDATFIGGDAALENGAYVASDGFSIVSESLVLGYRNGLPVSFFELEGRRLMSWGIGDGSVRLVSGQLSATSWHPVTPLDPAATTIAISVAGGACNNEIVTEIRFIEVVEADATVQVVVWTTVKPWPGICSGVGIHLDAAVSLTAPLGDRVLVDAGIFPACYSGVRDCP